MIRGNLEDKKLVIDILSIAFQNNKSVDYLIKKDSKRTKRIESLMEYSFDVCYNFGDVFLSDDKKACALLMYPDKKKTSLKTIKQDLSLIINSIGIANVPKTLEREKEIKKTYPFSKFYYLWYIGVLPNEQGKGIGSKLLNEIIKYSKNLQLPIYLETSTDKNIPWYLKHNFTEHNALNFSYTLHCLKLD